MTEVEAHHAIVNNQDFSKSMITLEDASHKMEKEIYQDGNGFLSNDQVSQLAVGIGKLGKEKSVYDANKEEETTKAETLEECHESEETTKQKEVKETKTAGASSCENGKSQVEQQQISEVIVVKRHESKLTKEENNFTLDKKNRMPSYQRLTQSRSLKTGTSSLERNGNASSQTQNSRLPKNSVTSPKTDSAIQTGKDKVLALIKKGNRAEVENIEVASTKSSLHKQITLGPTRSNCTVPKPFSLATGKRTSSGLQHTGVEVAQNDSRRTSNVTPPVAEKKQLTAKFASGVSETKLPPSVIHKTPTSTEASKGRPSIASEPAGTISRCNERAQKRKEFNSKLDEKLHAKEEEKRQLQAKTKEQQGEQLKKMRKILSFKAAPLPDFYHEVSPAKVESKKIPPTRAKSPKLGRRKSSIGTEPEDIPTQSHRTTHSAEPPQGDKACKTPSKGSSAVRKTMQNMFTKAYDKSTKKNSNRRESVTPKKDALGTAETEALADNENIVTSMSFHASESSIKEEKVWLQEDDAVKQKNEVESSNRQSMILESNSENDLPTKSDNLIAIVETAALIGNMQVSVGFH